MFIMKKSREEIKKSILNILREKPLSIQQISEKVGSNWSTVNDILEELKKEFKIRELLVTDKAKIFAIRDYPVFYGIPLKKEIIEECQDLMRIVLHEWKKEKKTIPPLTTIQKIAVDVVNNYNLALPVVDFHYGKVLPVIFKIEKQEPVDAEKLKKYSSILSYIRKAVISHSETAWKERRNQYKKYKMDLFQIKEDIQLIFSQKDIEKINKKELSKKIIEFSLKFPIYDEEIYSLFSRFESSSVLLLEVKTDKRKIKDYIQAIQESFEKIWDLLTCYLFFKGIKRFVSEENLQIFRLIKNMQLTAKINSCESSILELESFSNSIKMEEIPEIENKWHKEIGEILLGGIEEE